MRSLAQGFYVIFQAEVFNPLPHSRVSWGLRRVAAIVYLLQVVTEVHAGRSEDSRHYEGVPVFRTTIELRETRARLQIAPWPRIMFAAVVMDAFSVCAISNCGESTAYLEARGDTPRPHLLFSSNLHSQCSFAGAV